METDFRKYLHTYYIARQRCLQMLKDRKYAVPEHLCNIPESEFNANHTKYMVVRGIVDLDKIPVVIVMCKPNEDNDDIEIKRAINITDKTAYKLSEEKSTHIIVLYHPLGDKRDLLIGNPFVEVFEVDFMYIDRVNYIYQPKWTLMSKEDVAKLLQNVPKANLGSVCIDDPMNRYYRGFPASASRVGDIYKIIDNGVRVYYRKVINKFMNV